MLSIISTEQRLHSFGGIFIQIKDQEGHILNHVKYRNTILSRIIHQCMVDDQEKNKMPEMLNGAGQSDKEAGKAFLPLNLQHLLRLKTQKIPLSEKAGQIDADGNGLSKHCGNGGTQNSHIEDQHKQNIHAKIRKISNGKTDYRKILVIIIAKIVIQQIRRKQDWHTIQNHTHIFPAGLIHQSVPWLYTKKP